MNEKINFEKNKLESNYKTMITTKDKTLQIKKTVEIVNTNEIIKKLIAEKNRMKNGGKIT